MGAEAFPVELFHMVSLASKHSPDLVVTPLCDRQPRNAGRDNLQARRQTRFGFAAQYEITASESFDEFSMKIAVHLREVDLFYIRFG